MNKAPSYLKALIGLMLVSAVIHLVVLAFYYTKTHDAAPLNFFSIIGINLFFPRITSVPFAALYSFLAIFSIYCIILFFLTKKRI